MEVPICYPSAADCVYRVSDDDIYEADAREIQSRPATDAVSTSSISELACCTVISSPVDIERIALSKVSEGDAPIVIHLDFLCCKTFQVSNIIKIKAFQVEDGCIQVVLVSSSKSFMTLRFNEDLVPVMVPTRNGMTYVRIFQLPSEMATLANANMVDFLSCDVLVVGDSERMVTVDLRACSERVWEVEGIGNNTLFSRFTEAILGPLDAELHMETVASLCVLLDKLVFTLHCNGEVRVWVLNDDGMPKTFRRLPVKHIPDPSNWANTINSTCMTAGTYDNESPVFVLSIHIHCTVVVENTSELDDSVPSNNVIVVAHGPLDVHDIEDDGGNVYSIRLTVPPSIRHLVGMEFDPRSAQCQMKACFQTKQGAAFVKYPPSSVAIVSREHKNVPYVFLEDTIQEERSNLLRLKFHQIEDGTLEELLYQIDRKYLQVLFRPCFSRGTGSILPPSRAHIIQAIKTISHWPINTDGISIEVIVHRFMRQWRFRDHRTLVSPSAKTPSKSSTAVTLYDSININSIEEVAMVTTEAGNDRDDFLEKKKAVEEYERRWRKFLVEITKQEKNDDVTAVFLPLRTQDEFFIVRPACISSVPISAPKGWNDALLKLDLAALHLESSLQTDSESQKCIESAETFMLECISQGGLVRSTDAISLFSDMLGKIPIIPAMDPDAAVVTDFSQVLQEGVDIAGILLSAPLEHHMIQLASFQTAENRGGPTDEDGSWGDHDRLAAGSFFMRNLENSRTIFLNRYLVLMDRGAEEAALVALRMYLHALCLTSIAGRHVPFPPAENTLPGGCSPPKRPKVASKLEKGDMTSVLDALLIRTARELNPKSATSLADRPILLGIAALEKAFQFVGPQGAFPELGMLSAEDGSTDQPWICSLLMASFIAIPSSKEQKLVDVNRQQQFADYLLRVASTMAPEKATPLLDRAFGLLRFDVSDIQRSLNKMRTLYTRIVDGKGGFVAGKKLLDYTTEAIEIMERGDFDASDKGRFYSNLARVATYVRSWDTAFEACFHHPDPKRKVSNFRLLVREMVHQGALSKLVEICLSKPADRPDVFIEAHNLYEIAVDTLSEDWMVDTYALKADDTKEVADCFDALYALHVSQEQYRRAARCMDFRYLRALAAIRKSAPELNPEQQDKRFALIVDDLQKSSTACFLSLSTVEEKALQYIVSGKEMFNPSVPFYLSGESPEKHDRGGSLFSPGDESGVKERYMDLGTLHVRAMRASALQTLVLDGCKPGIVRAAFEDPSSVTNVELLERLCSSGFFQDALAFLDVVGKVSKQEMRGGKSFREELLELVALKYVVPLAFDTVEDRHHSLGKLEAAIDFLKEPGSLPCLLSGSRSKKPGSIAMFEVRSGAMELLFTLVNKNTFLAKPVALGILDRADRPQALPAWFEQLLMFGTDRSDLPGSFARRRKPGVTQYLGDPSALLNIYIMNGLYCDACRVVQSVLAGPSGDYRQDTASARLPEKGEVDFAPYHKIDLLYSLMEMEMTSGRQTPAGNAKLEDSRSQMVESLKKHFELLSMSQDGLASARALHSSS